MIKVYDERFYEVNDMYDAFCEFENHRTDDDWRNFNFKKYGELVIAEDEDTIYLVEVLPEGIRDGNDLDTQELDYNNGDYIDVDLSPSANLYLRLVVYDKHTGEGLSHYTVNSPAEVLHVLGKSLANGIEYC